MGKTKLRFFGNYWNELWFNNLGWWRWRLKMLSCVLMRLFLHRLWF
jgi:ubiquinone biosynthesis protein Coq4